MEGIQALPGARVRKPSEPAWPGYLIAFAVAAAAWGIQRLPFPPFQVGSGANLRHPVSAAIIAMVGGIVARNLFTLPAPAVNGAKKMARTAIPATIVLIGAGLDLTKLTAVGLGSLAITVLCIVLSTVTAVWVGKLLHVWSNTALLIGAGTAICGTSAIVAVAPLIDAADEDLMLSIGTINIMGLVMMFVLPALGGLLRLKDEAFGVWAGTSIHAVPQVVAAGFAYSSQAGALATLVKLVRVTFLVPYIVVLGAVSARGKAQGHPIPYARLIPGFLWGFMALALLNTLGLFPVLQFRFGSTPLAGLLTYVGELLLTLAMAAMGMEVNVRFFAKVGGRAILTGAIAAAVLCAGSLLLIHLLL